jgi:hypothetical protein
LSGKETTNDTIGDTPNENIDIASSAVTTDKVYMSFLVETKEPMFYAETTVRILIDSDNNPSTGYFYPGMGADHLIEIYGESQGLVSSSLLYMFDDSKERSDWNGFHSLTTLKSNATVGDWENSASGGKMEFQVPLFDLGIDAGDGIKFVITTSDRNGNYDSTPIINSATKQEQRYIDRVTIARQNANDNRNGALDGINIDGSFGDWTQNTNIKLDSDDETNPNSDILRYANFTDKAGDTFYYINVENSILGGTNFTDLKAKSTGSNSGGYDSTLGDGESITYDVPEMLVFDEIFILIYQHL